MSASVIRAKLGLLIRLTDTTTGAAVEESNVHFYVNGQIARPESRGDGCFVFINIERNDFCLQVEADGFEKASIDVCYEKMDDRIPTCDIFLIPSEKNAKGETVIGIFGNLPLLEALEAIEPDYPVCRISSFNVKTKEMTVIKQSGRMLDMSYGHYGLLKADTDSYEKIEVSETDSDSSAILKDVLKDEYAVNAPVCRVVFGSVRKDGSYYLRVRDNGKNQKWLVRYILDGKEYFQKIDLNEPETCKLTKHTEKAVPAAEDAIEETSLPEKSEVLNE